MQVSSVTVHYIEDMIILETEEQAKSDLNAMVLHKTNQGWLINPAKTWGPASTVKFWGISWAGATRDISQQTKSKLLSLPTPRPKQEDQCLIGSSGF